MDSWVPCLPRLGSCVPERQDDNVSGWRLRVPERRNLINGDKASRGLLLIFVPCQVIGNLITRLFT